MRLSYNKYWGIILHHSASDTDTPSSILHSHMSRGFATWGYHFMIMRTGAVVHGRDLKYYGAHCDDDRTVDNENDGMIGICLLGDFTNHGPAPAQVDALVTLIKSLSSMYKIKGILRHSDVDNTACPGKQFPYDEILKLVKEGSTLMFRDVPAHKWYASSVEQANLLGLMYGMGEDEFRPELPVTRAELAAVAVRLYNKIMEELDEDG